jgi:hypothetical protein
LSFDISKPEGAPEPTAIFEAAVKAANTTVREQARWYSNA